MAEILKEESSNSFDFQLSINQKKVRVGITLLGFDNKEQTAFFNETMLYKEKIKELLNGKQSDCTSPTWVTKLNVGLEKIPEEFKEVTDLNNYEKPENVILRQYEKCLSNSKVISISFSLKEECHEEKELFETLNFIATSAHRFYLDAAEQINNRLS